MAYSLQIKKLEKHYQCKHEPSMLFVLSVGVKNTSKGIGVIIFLHACVSGCVYYGAQEGT